MGTSAAWDMRLALLLATSQALTILCDVLAELRGWLLSRGWVMASHTDVTRIHYKQTVVDIIKRLNLLCYLKQLSLVAFPKPKACYS